MVSRFMLSVFFQTVSIWELLTNQGAPSLRATAATDVHVWIQETSAVINTPVCHVRHYKDKF